MPPRTSAATGQAPARTIQQLANIPPPEKASEFNHAYMSGRAVCETLAMVIDQFATEVYRDLCHADEGNMIDRAVARRRARRATAPLRQAAERVRGGGSSFVAAWARFTREYGDLMNPAQGRKRIDFTK